MQKYITSHSTRVRKAKEAIKHSPEKISIFDREAYVEFYLLEDIVRLYEYRLEKEKAKNYPTRAGAMTQKRNIEKFSAIVRIFKSAIDVAWGQMDSGDYKVVWKAIHEGALMAAASNVKNLPELRALAVELLRELSEETLTATAEDAALEEGLDELEAHEANVRSVRGLPSADEIDDVIKAVEAAIPDEAKTSKSKSRLDPNV